MKTLLSKSLSVRFVEMHAQELEKVAAQEGRTPSALVRMATLVYLKRAACVSASVSVPTPAGVVVSGPAGSLNALASEGSPSTPDVTRAL